MGSTDSSSDGSTRTGDELPRWAAEAAPPLPDLEQLRAALEQDIARERGLGAWLRSRSTPVRLTIAGLAVALLGVGTALFAGRADLSVYPLGRMVLLLVAIAALIACEVTLSLWPMHRPAPPRWLARSAIAAAPLALLALYSLPAAHSNHPALLQESGASELFVHALPCLTVGSLVALAGFLLLRSLDRGGAARALSMAASGGLAANLLLQLHCSITAPEHMLVGHLGVILLMLAAIALVERALPR
jgi:hypothetical protein